MQYIILFGERPVNNTLKCFIENYKNFEKCIDDIVIRRMKEFDENKEPTNVVEILLQSDVYKDNVTKVSNDVIMAMLGGTDTSRNNTIQVLHHLTKNKESK